MPIQSIEPRRLYRQISDQLRALILAGEFAEGSRLPAERDLSVQLGVSRPSLREALIALEVDGFVEVRKGSGIYVCAAPKRRASSSDLSGEEGPLELIRARALLEGEVAAIAAKTGKRVAFDGIEEAIELMQEAADAGKTPLDADRLFHVRIAEATGNSVLVGVVGRLFDLRLRPLFDQLDGHFATPDVWADAILEHRDILKALRAKDGAKARAMMQRHMEISYRRLTSSLIRNRRRNGALKAGKVNGKAASRPRLGARTKSAKT
jgi:DNA-binding FadR family transcriptional regulator